MSDIHEDIAKDILPKLRELKSKEGYYTYDEYVSYMKKRGADEEMIDSVMHYLVNLGFDFDKEPEDDLPDGWEDEIKLK
jgi:hypothetical protein